MVGDDDGVRADVDRATRVLAGQQTLHEQRAGPTFADPLEIGPRRWRGHPRSRRLVLRHGRRAGTEPGRVRDVEADAVAEEAVRPARVERELRPEAPRVARVDTQRELHVVARVALAVADDGGVDGDDERAVPGELGPLDQRLRAGATTDEVELEPQPVVGFRLHAHALGHVLERGSGHRAHDRHGARLVSRARHTDLAVGVHDPDESTRRGQHGQRDRRAEHRRAEVRLHVDGRTGPERDSLEGGAVGPHGDLVVGRAVHEVEHDPGQHAPRAPAGVGDAEERGHGSILSRDRYDAAPRTTSLDSRNPTRRGDPPWPTPSTGRCRRSRPRTSSSGPRAPRASCGSSAVRRAGRCCTRPGRSAPTATAGRSRSPACRAAPPSSASP